MLILSRTYESIGNRDRAVTVLEDLLEKEPEEIFRRQALKRLMQLKEEEGMLYKLTSMA
jgi:hypothetical protein